MSEFLFTAKIIIPLFLLIIFGYFLKKSKIVTEEFVKTGNKFSFKILLPIMLFMNIYKGNKIDKIDYKFLIALIVLITAIFFILFIILRLFYKDKRKLSVMIQAGFRSNFVLFGTYLMSNLYGDVGMSVVANYVSTVIILFNMYATIVLEFYSPQENAKINFWGMVVKIIKNPLIIASVLGIIVSIANFSFGSIIDKTLSNISSIATTFAMICLGGNLDFKQMINDKWNIIIASAIRLIIVPIIAVLLFLALGYQKEMLAVVLIIFATPVAVSSYVMAEQQGADSELAGGIVVFSTLMSTFTLFIFIYVLKYLTII